MLHKFNLLVLNGIYCVLLLEGLTNLRVKSAAKLPLANSQLPKVKTQVNDSREPCNVRLCNVSRSLSTRHS